MDFTFYFSISDLLDFLVPEIDENSFTIHSDQSPLIDEVRVCTKNYKMLLNI